MSRPCAEQLDVVLALIADELHDAEAERRRCMRAYEAAMANPEATDEQRKAALTDGARADTIERALLQLTKRIEDEAPEAHTRLIALLQEQRQVTIG